MEQATDAGTKLSAIARLRLNAELMGLIRQKAALQPSEPMAALKAARISAQIVTALGKMGVDLNAKARENKAFTLDGGPEPVPEPRVVTAQFYDFDPNRKHGERKRDNAEAMALLRRIDSGEIQPPLTDDQKQTLARYSGTGGNLVGADGKKGSAYEYYTPKPIAASMWDLMRGMGFKGGKVLDPCAGVGIFGANAPADAAMETVELNETSGRVNQLVNGGPGYNAIISPFESVASRTPDEVYDAVISNVPFGGVHDRGANRKIDPKYSDQPLETYFILRSLEKLKPGGLAAFIVPPRVVSAKAGREEQLRIAASYLAEFMGAYRLPNSVFGTADADTITDVIVFRKFGRDALAKIAELREQNPQVLVDARVQWTDFIGGVYFQHEGKRFVLGEFQAKDPNKFRDVDRVISDQTVPNIAKMLRKFPGSRIDWKMLNATETQPIEYAEGDTITMAGQTLEMREGAWVALGKAADDDRFDGLGQDLTSPRWP
jgi:predicted RNA methylase